MNATNTIVFKAGQLKYDLEVISKKRNKNLSSLVREALEQFVKEEKAKDKKKSNFLSRYRGVDNMNQEEMMAFTQKIRKNSQLRERDF